MTTTGDDALVVSLAEALGPACSPADARRTAADLLRRWREPHRRYHTADHLRATLDAVRELPAPADLDTGAVDLAVWFHDAVYAGRPGDDEEASAVLAERLLPGLHQPPHRVAEVARLVRLTARHDPTPDDVAGQLLCDADLAILAAPDSRYRAYADAVREEYAHVPDAVFRAARAQVLRGLLERPGALYRTDAARRLWQARALGNVRAELRSLTAPAG